MSHPAHQAPRVPCICGGRYSVHVAVEYIDPSGRVDYAGGRFCYINDALIDIGLPPDAIPLQATIYDWHEPDEIIRITFTRVGPLRTMFAETQSRGAYLT